MATTKSRVKGEAMLLARSSREGWKKEGCLLPMRAMAGLLHLGANDGGPDRLAARHPAQSRSLRVALLFRITWGPREALKAAIQGADLMLFCPPPCSAAVPKKRAAELGLPPNSLPTAS